MPVTLHDRENWPGGLTQQCDSVMSSSEWHVSSHVYPQVPDGKCSVGKNMGAGLVTVTEMLVHVGSAGRFTASDPSTAVQCGIASDVLLNFHHECFQICAT